MRAPSYFAGFIRSVNTACTLLHSASSASAFGVLAHAGDGARGVEQPLLRRLGDDHEALVEDPLRLAGGVVVVAALEQALADGAHRVVALGRELRHVGGQRLDGGRGRRRRRSP